MRNNDLQMSETFLVGMLLALGGAFDFDCRGIYAGGKAEYDSQCVDIAGLCHAGTDFS